MSIQYVVIFGGNVGFWPIAVIGRFRPKADI